MKRNIIKSMLTLCGVLFALGASADGLYISNFNALPNTATTVSVKMKNTNVISGYQFDLVLPAGVTLNSATASNARTSFTYNITKKSMSDGSIRILCMASGAANATFTGTDGEVMKLSLTSTSTGNKTLTIKNQVITESDLDELEPANATATMHVHALTATSAKSATCETAGNKAYWTCSGCNKVYSNNTATTETTVANMTIAALGHSYGAATWTWTGYTAASVSKTCSHDSSHKLSATATITNAVTTAATCTSTGVRTYTATATLDGATVTDKKTETIAKIAHSYSAAPTAWNWGTDGKSCTATYKCANCTTTEARTATITSAVKTAATCTVKGTTTYTATVNSSTSTTKHTSTKDVQDIAALGHSYGTATWAWTGYTAATVSKTCSHDSSHKLSATATITNAVTTAATCTDAGVRTYTATATLNGASLSDTKTETIAAKGHNYGEAVWTWNGLTSASAKITCANEPKHVISGNATITNAVTTPATDTTDGIRTYTAKVTLNNKEYTDQKTETIQAKGHTYGAPTWSWTGTSAAKAVFECTQKDDTQEVNATITNAITKQPTCEEAGERTYTATVTFNNLQYTDTKTETIAAKGHSYGEAIWTWNGLTSALAKITCTNDPKHVLSGNATITNAVTTPATDTTDGIRTYTAKVTLNNKEYTDQKTETIQAKGHTYGAPTWSWTGTSAAKAVFECTQKDDTQEVNATITNAITKQPTCEEAGERTYTATVTFNNLQYTDTKTETIAAKGHSYSEAVWTWNGTSSASAKITCANDPKHVVEANASITSVVKVPATCTAKGTTTYTAKITLAGKEYIDNKDVEDIDMISHILSCKDNNDGTHTILCQICDYSVTEKHNFVSGVCTNCGTEDIIEDTDISAYNNVIYTENVEMCAGGNVTLSIKMKNNLAMTGYQFNLYVPAGIDLSTSTATRSNIRKDENVSFSKSVQTDGSLRVLCYTTDNEAFSGNDGEICKVTFSIPNGYTVGNYPIYITTQRLTAGGATRYVNEKIKSTLTVKDYILGDANSNGDVEVGDLSAIVGFILNTNIIPTFNEQAANANCNDEVEVGDLSTIVKMILGVSNAKGVKHSAGTFNISVPQFNLCPGEEATVSINMQNSTMSGFQFDINMPEGLVCTKAIPVASRIDSDSFFGYSMLDNLTTRVLCYSPSDTNISGKDGNIVVLKVKAREDMVPGEYYLNISNIRNTEGHHISNFNCPITVSKVTGIYTIIADNPDAIIYDVKGRIVKIGMSDSKQLPKGIYIINGKKYINK